MSLSPTNVVSLASTLIIYFGKNTNIIYILPSSIQCSNISNFVLSYGILYWLQKIAGLLIINNIFQFTKILTIFLKHHHQTNVDNLIWDTFHFWKWYILWYIIIQVQEEVFDGKCNVGNWRFKFSFSIRWTRYTAVHQCTKPIKILVKFRSKTENSPCSLQKRYLILNCVTQKCLVTQMLLHVWFKKFQ